MRHVSPSSTDRQRAPSKRAVQTKIRIFDAAEQLFAERNFEGASLRDIATKANVPVALVSFHGGSKNALFHAVVERRADELSRLRLQRLADLKAGGQPLTARSILKCTLLPHLEKVIEDGPQWLAYVRLVAMVSADPRWHDISKACFDPTAAHFIDELSAIYPEADKAAIATSYVFSVSAMLSLCTSIWRISALSNDTSKADLAEMSANLIDFSAAGMHSVLRPK